MGCALRKPKCAVCGSAERRADLVKVTGRTYVCNRLRCLRTYYSHREGPTLPEPQKTF